MDRFLGVLPGQIASLFYCLVMKNCRPFAPISVGFSLLGLTFFFG